MLELQHTNAGLQVMEASRIMKVKQAAMVSTCFVFFAQVFVTDSKQVQLFEHLLN